MTRVDAFYDEIQNAAYSYSESLWSRDAIDEEDDATFARLVQTEEALVGSNSSCQGLSQDELVWIAVHQSICRHFITVRFLLGSLP